MPLRTRIGRRTTRTGLATLLALAGCAGLLIWWNTDVMGQGRFCNGALASSELSPVLDGPGRLTVKSVYEGSDPYGFSCTVQRTSRFLEADQPEMKAELSFDTADFAIGSRLWKDPSASSYFVGGATGAASETQAWVLLPTSCADKTPPGFQRANVPALKVDLTHGRAAREDLAQAAMSAARHIAEGLGCTDSSALKAPVQLQGPSGSGEPQPTDPANACGMAGFRLPEAALLKGKAEPGTERVTGSDSKTRVCELTLKGPGAPHITLAASEDPLLTQGVRRDDTATPQNTRTVSTCTAGDLYVAMSYDDTYRDLLLDAGSASQEQARTTLFKAFFDTVAKDRGCRTS
ncbi:hypothetical protein ACIQU4_01980 [Streptomyces sp. NPDC090741]|uniref:hypothetical protein n=1 Tax=Streptomyces sp. NPDC090741 TaxID=3365967 RepID=UPI00380F7378